MSNPFKYFKDKKEIWADWPTNFRGLIENEIVYDLRPHFPVSPEPDWEEGKIVYEGKDYQLNHTEYTDGIYGKWTKYIAIPINQTTMNRTNISRIKMPKVFCKHDHLIDTGVGYYFCPACRSSWTNEELKPEQMEKDDFIERQLQRIKEKSKDFLIHEHIEKMWGGLEMASIEYFMQTGRINGSFRNRLIDLIEAAQRYKMNFAQSPKEEKQDIPMEKAAELKYPWDKMWDLVGSDQQRRLLQHLNGQRECFIEGAKWAFSQSPKEEKE